MAATPKPTARATAPKKVPAPDRTARIKVETQQAAKVLRDWLYYTVTSVQGYGKINGPYRYYFQNKMTPPYVAKLEGPLAGFCAQALEAAWQMVKKDPEIGKQLRGYNGKLARRGDRRKIGSYYVTIDGVRLSESPD